MKLHLLISASVLSLVVGTIAIAAESVNVYSYRQPFLIEPMFDAFTKDTGIEVNTVFAKKGLVERLKNEGKNSPADVLLTSDFSNLSAAVAADITQAVESDILNKNIPAEFRDPDNVWFGLTNRARLIAVSKIEWAALFLKVMKILPSPNSKAKFVLAVASTITWSP